MASELATGLTQALLGGVAGVGQGMQTRQAEGQKQEGLDRRAALQSSRDTAIANIKAQSTAATEASEATEAKAGRDFKASESKLTREGKAAEGVLDRASREKIAGSKDTTPEFDQEGADADVYADERVSEQAGWFESDEESFKDFGGSKTKAKEFYRTEFLQGRSGTGTDTGGQTTTPSVTKTTKSVDFNPTQTKIMDAVRQKYPDATDEQIIEAVKDDARYSKYF